MRLVVRSVKPSFRVSLVPHGHARETPPVDRRTGREHGWASMRCEIPMETLAALLHPRLELAGW